MKRIDDNDFDIINKKLDSIKKDTNIIKKVTTSKMSKFLNIVTIIGFILTLTGISIYTIYKEKQEEKKEIIPDLPIETTQLTTYIEDNDSDISTTINFPIPIPEPNDYNLTNTNTNIINGGFVCCDEKNYYFGGENGLISIDTNNIDNGKRNMLYKDNTYTAAYYINLVGDYLYFITSNNSDANNIKSKVCRIKKDKTDFEVIYENDNFCYELTYYKNCLYFCSGDNQKGYYICRLNPNGSKYNDFDFTKLARCNEWYLTIDHNKIYFTDYENKKNIYFINIDDNDKIIQPFYNKSCYDLCMVNNKLYFSDKERKLCYIDTNTGNFNSIPDIYARNINYYNNKLYYIDPNTNRLHSYDIDSDKTELCYEMGTYSFINLLPNGIYSYDKQNNKILFGDYITHSTKTISLSES